MILIWGGRSEAAKRRVGTWSVPRYKMYTSHPIYTQLLFILGKTWENKNDYVTGNKFKIRVLPRVIKDQKHFELRLWAWRTKLRLVVRHHCWHSPLALLYVWSIKQWQPKLLNIRRVFQQYYCIIKCSQTYVAFALFLKAVTFSTQQLYHENVFINIIKIVNT